MALVDDIDGYSSLPPVLETLRQLMFMSFEPSRYRAGCPCRIKPETGHFLWQIRRRLYPMIPGLIIGAAIAFAGVARLVKILGEPRPQDSAIGMAVLVIGLGLFIFGKVLRNALQVIFYYHFQSVRGDVAPVIVVQEKPVLLALIFDVSMGDTPSRHVLKVFQPEPGAVNNVELGHHFGATCYYGSNDEGTEWADVLATPLTVYTTNRQDIQDSVSRVNPQDWGELEAAIATLPPKPQVGVYRLDNGSVGALN